MCADYRASVHLDRRHDNEDSAAGRRIRDPTLVVTGADQTQLDHAGAVWSALLDTLRAQRVPSGRFLEQAPGPLADLLIAFLGQR